MELVLYILIWFALLTALAVVDLESRAPKHSDITSEVVGRIREDVRSTPQKVDMITGQLRIQGQRSASTRRETRIAESGFT